MSKTIEEKAKAYDEAIERAKNINRKPVKLNPDITTCEYIFPELKENEDEKIRKELIRAFQSLNTIEVWNGIKRADIIAWLEKQKSIDELTQQEAMDIAVAKCFDEQKPDNAEPKFKVGDWIIRSAEGFKHNTYLVTEVKDYYVCEELKGRRVTFTFNDVHKNFKLWDISDAKDGDILANYNIICIYKKRESNHLIKVYLTYSIAEGIEVTDDTIGDFNLYPATEEDRDALLKAMTNASYVWDAEKKELKKIEPIDEYEGLTDFERTLTDICIGWIGKEIGWKQYIKDNADVLLKIAVKKFNSVQDAPFEPKTEWSEEDEIGWTNTMIMIKETASNHYTKDSIKLVIDWLESIKQKIGG